MQRIHPQRKRANRLRFVGAGAEDGFTGAAGQRGHSLYQAGLADSRFAPNERESRLPTVTYLAQQLDQLARLRFAPDQPRRQLDTGVMPVHWRLGDHRFPLRLCAHGSKRGFHQAARNRADFLEHASAELKMLLRFVGTAERDQQSN